jgi:hypothetical protein
MSETSARMRAAQIAVHQNSSIVKRSVSASVIASRPAFTSRADRPRVRIVSGSVRMRRIVPTTALTIPKIAETQT